MHANINCKIVQVSLKLNLKFGIKFQDATFIKKWTPKCHVNCYEIMYETFPYFGHYIKNIKNCMQNINF